MKKDNPLRPPTKKEFYNWIKSLKEHDEFLYSLPSSCPIAIFFLNIRQVRIQVAPEHYSPAEGDGYIPLPKWLQTGLCKARMGAKRDKYSTILDKQRLMKGFNLCRQKQKSQ